VISIDAEKFPITLRESILKRSLMTNYNFNQLIVILMSIYRVINIGHGLIIA
jgi:hypothetical protein